MVMNTRPPAPLARLSATFSDPQDPTVLLTLEVVVLATASDGPTRLAMGLDFDAGWMNASTGDLSLWHRVIGT